MPRALIVPCRLPQVGTFNYMSPEAIEAQQVTRNGASQTAIKVRGVEDGSGGAVEVDEGRAKREDGRLKRWRGGKRAM